MSYASGTTHYNLPQTIGSDKRDWTDTNQAFSDVDAALYAAAQGAESAASAISSIQSDITTIQGKQSTDEGNITTLQGKVSTLEGTVSGQGTEINDVRRDLQDNIESKHESSATSTHAYAIGDTFYYNDVLYKATAVIAIGDTIVPNTNCTGVTVMSELQSGSASPTAANVSYDDTTSGLQADDVQEAIDKLLTFINNIDIRYTVANGAEWSPRGAGTWTPFNSGTSLNVFKDGAFKGNYDIGTSFINTGEQTTANPLTVSNSVINVPNPYSVSVYNYTGSRIAPQVDFTDISQLVIRLLINGVSQAVTIDTTSVTGLYNIGVLGVHTTGSTMDYYLDLGVYSSNNTTPIADEKIAISNSGDTITIDEIYLI